MGILLGMLGLLVFFILLTLVDCARQPLQSILNESIHIKEDISIYIDLTKEFETIEKLKEGKLS